MKKYKRTFIIGAGLIGLSIILHYVHYLVFKDVHHVLIYLLGDVAFIPLEVFFVSVVLEELIEARDERQITKKLNMLIGLFYQELGNDVLNHFVRSDEKVIADRLETTIDFEWDESKYNTLTHKIKSHKPSVMMAFIDVKHLDNLLSHHKTLIINLITNPTIHEHGPFSDVLMTLFHLADELKHRPLDALTKEDLEHLKIDIDRVYKQLAVEWVVYMSHLQVEYPYLFSTAVKNNPFDPRNKELS